MVLRIFELYRPRNTYYAIIIALLVKFFRSWCGFTGFSFDDGDYVVRVLVTIRISFFVVEMFHGWGLSKHRIQIFIGEAVTVGLISRGYIFVAFMRLDGQLNSQYWMALMLSFLWHPPVIDGKLFMVIVKLVDEHVRLYLGWREHQARVLLTFDEQTNEELDAWSNYFRDSIFGRPRKLIFGLNWLIKVTPSKALQKDMRPTILYLTDYKTLFRARWTIDSLLYCLRWEFLCHDTDKITQGKGEAFERKPLEGDSYRYVRKRGLETPEFYERMSKEVYLPQGVGFTNDYFYGMKHGRRKVLNESGLQFSHHGNKKTLYAALKGGKVNLSVGQKAKDNYFKVAFFKASRVDREWPESKTLCYDLCPNGLWYNGNEENGSFDLRSQFLTENLITAIPERLTVVPAFKITPLCLWWFGKNPPLIEMELGTCEFKNIVSYFVYLRYVLIEIMLMGALVGIYLLFENYMDMTIVSNTVAYKYLESTFGDLIEGFYALI